MVDWPAAQLRRRRVREMWLAQHLGAMRAQLRQGLTAEKGQALQLRDLEEQLQLLRAGEGASAADVESLPGRQSGAEAWRTARGETGR